jgi:3-deoxy-D-manno-octulosonic acid kinase
MIKGGQRIATATGIILADPHTLGNAQQGAPDALFDPDYWAARGELATVSGGRGSAWFVGSTAHPWVLRHYRRGGFMARISNDRYWWSEEDRVRSFAEWRLLFHLTQHGLAVPKPVAAFYQRERWTYRCDLITERISPAQPLSAALQSEALAEAIWRAVGAAVARLHRHGVDHADLNAHNILLGSAGMVSVVDFDRSQLRAPGAWTFRNLARLKRSLRKIAAALPKDRFTATSWEELLAGYQTA